MTFTLLRRGELIAVPPPEKALEFLANEEPLVRGRALARPAPRRRRNTPTPSAQSSKTSPLKYGADEVIAVNILYDHQARRRSYELLAEAFAG